MNQNREIARAQLNSAITDLTRRLGRAPNATEVAHDLAIDRDEVIERLLRARPSALKPARPTERRGEPDQATSLDDMARKLAATSGFAKLPALLEVLSPEERTAVLLRFSQSMTQSQIAARLGVSPTSVCRILTRSLQVLRDYS